MKKNKKRNYSTNLKRRSGNIGKDKPSGTSKSPLHKQKKQPQEPLLLLFNKPFNVLCQFTDDNCDNNKSDGDSRRETLKDYIPIKDVYAAGRLDRDSEGLLLLTNDGQLQHKLTEPTKKTYKRYWVQVEGIPSIDAIESLRKGVKLKDGLTRPAKVKRIDEPDIWPRKPPIRERKNIATTWLEISICEGKNRQVRRMTAHVGYPTLRLIRCAIGQWQLNNLPLGKYKVITLN